jgi:intein/homing endonuclease
VLRLQACITTSSWREIIQTMEHKYMSGEREREREKERERNCEELL